MKNKIFISHCSKDISYVKLFVEKILILGLEIPAERIFCSSMEGQGIKSGEYIPDRLKTEINQSALAMLFISNDYKMSEICLNEVGAAWATLEKEMVKPLVLSNVEFSDIGILNLNRIAIKPYEKTEILKLIDDCKEILNLEYSIPKINCYVDEYLRELSQLNGLNSNNIDDAKVDEWKECFENNLYPYDEIIRKAIPANHDGIHRITETNLQNQILSDLSQLKRLKDFWYKFSGGDYYVGKMKKTTTGNWLISDLNWEIKIQDMFVGMYSELQNEFILIKTAYLGPYQINSDIGGTSLSVGILNDGTIISRNELNNGYAIINGERINLTTIGAESRERDNEEHWIFIVSCYHKPGNNPDEAIDFCKKLDNKEIAATEENIMNFLKKLRAEPTVMKYR